MMANVDKVRDVLNAIKDVEVDKIEVDNYDIKSDTVIKITILNPINKVQTIKPIKIKK